MIPWWWTIISLIIGEIAGIVIVTFCSANEPKQPVQKSKYIK